MAIANRSGGHGAKAGNSRKRRRASKVISGVNSLFGPEKRAKRIQDAQRRIARKKAKGERFVLVYQGLSDPDPQNVAAVKRVFGKAEVEEVFPGTLRITGDRSALEQSAKGLKSWTLAPEGIMSDTPPSQGRFRTL